MIKAKVQNEFNKQINRELYSAYLYVAMAAYFESINFKGFSKWLQVQAKEETGHAERFYKFLFARGGKPVLAEIAKPQEAWASPLKAFEAAYEHEKKITAFINGLVELADQEKDYASGDFLQWFVTEQVEEEYSTNDVVKKLKLIGDSVTGLFMLDAELGKRESK